jgi:hypothetical protein
MHTAVTDGDGFVRRCNPGADGARRTMIVVDISEFGNRMRDDEVRLFVRKSLYGILRDTFNCSGVGWERCRRADQGDGVFIVLPPRIPAVTFINPLAGYLAAKLRSHNKMSGDAAKIRLRMAAHTGQVYFDDDGMTGEAVIKLFRLLNANALRRALAAATADLGLMISDDVHDEMVRNAGELIGSTAYRRIRVTTKETRTTAWLCFPDWATTARTCW